MNKKIVINLNLWTVKFPFTSIISFLHRVSGLFVFLLLPFLLCVWEKASGGAEGFQAVQMQLIHPISKITLWLFLCAFWYHLIAGLRHIVMDIGFGEHLQQARITGAIVLLITIGFAILSGVWLW